MGLLVGKTPGGSFLCSWCWLISRDQLYRQGSTPGEGVSRERAEAGKGDDEEGAADLFLRRRSRRKGAVDPVSEKRGQEEKGEVAT